MSDNNNTLMTFIAGAAVGATAALLLAPRSGAETRKAIREGVADAVERTQRTIDDARTRAGMLPDALNTAGTAAREAFTEHYQAANSTAGKA